MSHNSGEDNSDPVLHEEIDDGPPASAVGEKRRRTQPRRKPAHSSPVWEHFVQQAHDDAITNCRYCGQEIGCDTVIHGTSAMKNHISRSIKYDQGLFRRSVNEMIVLNELSFAFVESEGFRRLCSNMLPMYIVHCRKTATSDIYTMFLRHKEALKELFSKKQRVSMPTDIWVAPTTSCSYMVVTAHWIDRDWKLQKRIISFKPVTYHKGDTIAEHLVACLEEWGIEKVFTVTVDNAKGNDKALRVFTDALIMRGPDALVSNVRDGKRSIVSIRNAIKYVRSSGDRLKSFLLRVDTGNVGRGSLCLDVATRWNSTYLMLTAAIKFRVAFEKMLTEDKLYNDYFMETEENGETTGDEAELNGQKRVGPPTFADWDQVQRLVKFLKIFFNCTLSFSATKSVTSTFCYNEIVTIERNLINLSTNGDVLLKTEAMMMRSKFEKYCDGLLNMNPLVIIASVFDPRNKMQFAGLCFDKLYRKDSVESTHLRSSIKGVMKKLYAEYVMKLSLSESGVPTTAGVGTDLVVSANDLFDLSDEDGYERMDTLYSEMVAEITNEECSSELDIYLLEKPVPRTPSALGLDFDVLSWWGRNSSKFPVLSELARDILAVQVSSVASESAFSTSGRILDPYRSSMSPFMVESLVCTQQWLRNAIQAEKLASLVQMFEELQFHESLATQNATHAAAVP
ncbi:PREDICTED: zinc finger BED domain-containing protein RICESLEEPER 2-like [Camelina sativa]|uniref:Zinc finger BED domain-containing protein RICESLEEPER 2-like n=1 Tax=Camelina sativa TaxID=90675 RepID=A0ABM0XRV8_CAMSA|nr:PREDICTED: zinc finger BED domain-containing protein RICESLEEPER 2-like [Camelina sativa]